MPDGALKYDTRKPPIGLIPRSAVEAEARVLGLGAQKYTPDNWRRGLSWRRMINSALRHLHAIADGEDWDAETGELHAACARCELGFLIEHQVHGLGTDDRYKRTNPVAPRDTSATVGVSWSEGPESLPEEPPTPATRPASFTFWYLATPYISALQGVLNVSDTPKITAALVRSLVVFRGIPVFCPVVHSQGWVSTGRRPNYELWVKTNEPFMRAAGGLIVATMEGWSESRDVDYAIALFRSAGKPVLCWDPISAPPLEKLRKHMGPA